MKKIIDYTDENRDALIVEQETLGFTLIEDQRHFDGNHLIFEDGKPEPQPRDPLTEIDKLKADYNTLKSKVDILEKK